MAKCSSCGASFWRLDLIKGMCPPCATEAERQAQLEPARLAALRASANALILTTETAPIGMTITERVGVVSCECAFGMHIFKDAFTEIRDIVGGRSRALEKTLADARETALSELRLKAAEIGADAVIAVDLDFSEFGRSAIIAIATGTAVKLSSQARPIGHVTPWLSD